jgi:hypothetical protein
LQYHPEVQTLFAEVFGPLIVAFVVLGAVLGVRRLLHQFRNRLTPEQLQAARDSFRSRLIHPKAAEVEQGIGALLPQRLIALYNDHPSVLAEQLEIRRPDVDLNEADSQDAAEWIEAFLPLDLESQKYTIDLPSQGWGKGFCFATDGSGNFYWTPATPSRQPDAPVFFACHDPHGNEQVAASLDEFLSWPRTLHSPEAQRVETTP